MNHTLYLDPKTMMNQPMACLSLAVFMSLPSHDHDQQSPDAMATTAAASKLSTHRRRLFTYETGEEGASEELYTIQKGKTKALLVKEG